jgi:hypothetical protein
LQKKIEKINKRRISQSALGQKEFEPINECQTVKIDLKINTAVNAANSMLYFDWTSCSLIRFIFLFCNLIG